MNKLMFDCGLKPLQLIYLDNTAAIKMAQEGGLFSPKNKHIAVHYHAVMERIRHGDVTFEYIPTSEMVADIFTKPLERIKFEKFRSELGVLN